MTILSNVRLFTSYVVCLFFDPLSCGALCTVARVVPPLVCIVYVVIGRTFIGAVDLACGGVPFLHVTPVYGKGVCITPHDCRNRRPNGLSVPVRSCVCTYGASASGCTGRMRGGCDGRVAKRPRPHFDLGRLMGRAGKIGGAVVLCVLPLGSRRRVRFAKKGFMAPRRVRVGSTRCDSFLGRRVSRLGVIARV